MKIATAPATSALRTMASYWTLISPAEPAVGK
jgi:hypothetical protein